MSPSPLVRAAASPAPRSDAIHSPSDAKRCSKLSRARRCWLRATAACRLPPERVWSHNALSSQHLPLAEGAHQNATPEDANERPRLTSLTPTPVHRLRNPCVAISNILSAASMCRRKACRHSRRVCASAGRGLTHEPVASAAPSMHCAACAAPAAPAHPQRRHSVSTSYASHSPPLPPPPPPACSESS